MKKLAIILTLAMLISLLAGCAGTPVIYYTDCTCPVGSHTETPNEEVPSTEAPVLAEGAVKTGLAIITSVGKSTSATAEAEGVADYDVTIAAVNVDENGVIVSCVIDSVGATINFGADGIITTDLKATVLTKNELGDSYGMKAHANSKYEWYEQAANFAAYVTGKTAADVAGIAIDEGTKPTDADLSTSVTIAIGGFLALIAKAAQK